ncbi:hypothetical protein HDU96_010838 [Phlyctochytrium bullatum]|nr:hypothetical protein HDU96_010838 [Phlyctochytrium bullatum]
MISELTSITDESLPLTAPFDTLNLRHCDSLTDAGVVPVLRGCPRLHTLDVAILGGVTGASVAADKPCTPSSSGIGHHPAADGFDWELLAVLFKESYDPLPFDNVATATVYVSSQVGCSFCHTGTSPSARFFPKFSGPSGKSTSSCSLALASAAPPANYGEPLWNFSTVAKACRVMWDVVGLSPWRTTLSVPRMQHAASPRSAHNDAPQPPLHHPPTNPIPPDPSAIPGCESKPTTAPNLPCTTPVVIKRGFQSAKWEERRGEGKGKAEERSGGSGGRLSVPGGSGGAQKRQGQAEERCLSGGSGGKEENTKKK